MAPFLHNGAELSLTRCTEDDVQIGDIVLIERNHVFVVHRVVRREGDKWITRGDAFVHEDCAVEGEHIWARTEELMIGQWKLPFKYQEQKIRKVIVSGLPWIARARNVFKLISQALPYEKELLTHIDVQQVTSNHIDALIQHRLKNGLSSNHIFVNGNNIHIEGIQEIFLAYHNNEVVGQISLTCDLKNQKLIHVIDFFVDTKFQGKGIERALLHEVKKLKQKKYTFHTLQVNVLHWNHSVRKALRDENFFLHS